MGLFRGLSAFPITPCDERGRVDTEALGALVERLSAAGVDSIGVLGSTGIYPFLTREERRRAVAAAVASAGGRTPIMAGIGALRTDEVQALARDAEAAGAQALLLAPVSYTPLTQNEVFEHFRTVSETTALPICIYNNPATTHFTFDRYLLMRLGDLETVRAVKMPLPPGGDFAQELQELRARTGLSIGYSGDWGMADAMLAGADAFYGVLAGILPRPTLALARAAMAGETEEARRIDATLAPLWDSFKAHGSLRAMYALFGILSLGKAAPPLPIQPLGPDAQRQIAAAVESLPASD